MSYATISMPNSRPPNRYAAVLMTLSCMINLSHQSPTAIIIAHAPPQTMVTMSKAYNNARVMGSIPRRSLLTVL